MQQGEPQPPQYTAGMNGPGQGTPPRTGATAFIRTVGQPTTPPGQNISGIDPAILAKATPYEQKQILAEKLFPLIRNVYPDLAGKVTGMLLEIDSAELLLLLEQPEQLKSKVDEAVLVLTSHIQHATRGRTGAR